MAIDSIPPWLNVNPDMAVQALEAGARTGLASSEADQRAASEARGLDFEKQKLTATLGESAADRALREKLTTKAATISQNRFDTQTAMDRAVLQLRQSALQLQQAKQAHLEQIQKENNVQKSAIDADASEFWKDSADGSDPKTLAEKHPLALKRKDIQAFLAQQAMAERSKKGVTRRVETSPTSGRIEKNEFSGPANDPGWSALSNSIPKKAFTYDPSSGSLTPK
jgi:hypothetical protein